MLVRDDGSADHSNAQRQRYDPLRRPARRRPMKDDDFLARPNERIVLVLQGGGALGAYQAGVYEGMAEQGFAPNWVAGVSIGAINASLIAGNVAKLRVERLARILAPRFIGRANACPC